MLDCISNTENKNPQLNPLRLSKTHGKTILVTTGQIMLIPGEKTLYYRPIWCEINFNFNKIDSPKTKTYFEIISSRKILGETFKQYYENSMS